MELAAALPEQRKAIAALKVIDKAEIKELSKYNSVSQCIQDVCWGWVIITNTKAIKERDPNTLKNVVQEWKTIQGTLGSLFEDITNFVNERDLDEKTCLKLKKHINNPNRKLGETEVGKASTACAGVNKWLKAQEVLFWVNKKVRPLKKSLAAANSEVAGLTKDLK